ncbi:MAG: SMC-Scp complex subunit ScpB [Acidiferrobacterales bacterium]
MSDEIFELKNIIEAALLAAGEPLTVDRMLSMFPADSRPSRQAIGEALKALAREYEGRGIELRRIDRSYRFQTCEKYAAWIARLQQERPARYSRALLETLAIIAYKQPVTRGDIEAIRGVSVSTEIIRTLLEREWIRQVGHRDVPGKPALYGTTRQFIEHFNLASLDELPALAELRDFEQIGRELDERLGAAERKDSFPTERVTTTPEAVPEPHTGPADVTLETENLGETLVRYPKREEA